MTALKEEADTLAMTVEKRVTEIEQSNKTCQKLAAGIKSLAGKRAEAGALETRSRVTADQLRNQRETLEKELNLFTASVAGYRREHLNP